MADLATLTPSGWVPNNIEHKDATGAERTNLTTLLAGENQPLGLIETSAPGAYVNGNAVTSGADINLGSPGAAGNKLYGIAVFNDNSTQSITAATLWDGATQVTAYSLAALQVANNAYGLWVPPLGGVLESKNGGWRLRLTCTGTMANIRWHAVVAE
jgi:hypothetical protein